MYLLVQAAMAKGGEAAKQASLATCDCDAMPGCWAGDGVTCEMECSGDACNIETGECSQKSASGARNPVLSEYIYIYLYLFGCNFSC